MNKLILFILRRERVITTVWLVILIFMTVVIPPLFETMYTDEIEKLVLVETMKNPFMVAMMGPVYGANDYHVGAMQANEMLLFTILAVVIMNIFFVLRHTRSDEERGRIEVIRSLPVGRLSTLGATMTVAVIINAALAVVSGLGLTALGIESMPFGSNMLYGAEMGVSGLFFAAVTALFAQLSANARTGMGLTYVVFGISYMMRAIGDINNETLSLISPLGLVLRTKVYVDDTWRPIFVILAVTAVVTLISIYLNHIRDLGQGFIPARPGRKNASMLLSTSFGLSFKLLRGTIIAWVVIMFVFGAAYGSIFNDVESIFASNELFMQMIPANSDYSVTELFMSVLFMILSMVNAIPVVNIIGKLWNEEKRNLTEHIASKAVSKTKMLANYFIWAVIGSLLIQFASVLGLWAASSAVMDTPIPFINMLKEIMIFMPATWVMLGLAMYLIGRWPTKLGICYAYIGVSAFVLYFGPMMKIPEWVGKISPYGYIPNLPIEEINYLRLGLLVAIAVVLAITGFVAYRHRDLQG